MRLIKRTVIGSVTVLAATAGGVTALAAPAAAVPARCQTLIDWGYSGVTNSHCTGGTGQYRAVASCSVTPNGNFRVTIRGVAYGTGDVRWSYAACDSNTPYLRNGYTEVWG